MTADRRLLLWLLLLASLGVAVYALRAALMPFIVGMAIAYILDPIADRLEALGAPRGLATALIVVGSLVAFVAILVILVPMLSAQVIDLIARLPAYAGMLEKAVEPYVAELKANLSRAQTVKLTEFLESHAGEMISWMGAIAAGLLSGGAALVGLLGLLVITPVVAFYLLRDWDRLVAHIDGLLPLNGGPAIRAIAREIDGRLSGFVRGQMIVSLILGGWYASGLVLIGLDFGLLVGVVAGLLSVIPYVGSIVGLGTSLGLAFAQFDGWIKPALVASVFLSGQILEGYVLQPKIVGDRVGLHPVWLMFAVIAGTALLGITGALLAVPIAAVIGVLVRHATQRYLQSALYGDLAASEPTNSASSPAGREP